MKNGFFLSFVLCFLSILPCVASNERLPAKEIVKRCDDLMSGNTQEGVFTMTITTPSWERTLKFTVSRKGRDKVFIRILSPSKEKGITTLRIKNETWVYLPGAKRVLKIPPSMMLEPWMGSDFANDDLVKEISTNDYVCRILKEEKSELEDVYVIELTPGPGAGAAWDKRILRIRKNGFIPVREEFYGKKNKLVKTLFYSDVKKVSDRTIPCRWEMVSETKKGHRTTIDMDKKVVYNKPIDDGVFSL
jgi:outer membrane lipoprotein-sorting protein